MSLRIIFVDLNSYFASVEQAERPELMGLPVAVVPMMAETTCCLAASYPAKAKGVKTGTLVKDARRLCPNIVFIEADHRKYVSYHHKIIAAVDRCLPVWKVFSIDEMAIQLFGKEQNLNFATAKAYEIKKRILTEVHPALTCSIGIGPNRYIAKIASDMQKPDGLTIIQSEELPQRLYNLELRDFPGIGARMEDRLIRARCFTGQMLCEKSPTELRQLWGGRLGEDLWRLLRGEELDELETKRGSIGHSRVLAPDSRTPECAWSHLVALTSKAAMRLRDEGFYARTLHLFLKFLQRGIGTSYWEKKVKFLETQDTGIFLKELTNLWEQSPKQNIFKISIVLSSLVPAQKHQLSFFEDPRRPQLMSAMDRLNKMYRKNIVVFGTSIELKRMSHAPISFGHIPRQYE